MTYCFLKIGKQIFGRIHTDTHTCLSVCYGYMTCTGVFRDWNNVGSPEAEATDRLSDAWGGC